MFISNTQYPTALAGLGVSCESSYFAGYSTISACVNAGNKVTRVAQVIQGVIQCCELLVMSAGKIRLSCKEHIFQMHTSCTVYYELCTPLSLGRACRRSYNDLQHCLEFAIHYHIAKDNSQHALKLTAGASSVLRAQRPASCSSELPPQFPARRTHTT